MSLSTLPSHYQTDFEQNWLHLVQQMESRLEGKYKLVTVKGKERRFSLLGKGSMRHITTRSGTTIPSDSPMAMRWLRPKGYERTTFIDEFDDVALGELPAPESEHVQQHAYAAKRTIDEIVIGALEGTAYIGEDGTTAVDLGNANKVAVDFVQSGSAVNSGLTLAKLARAKYILDKFEVEQSGRYFIHSAKQLNDLLVNAIEIKSSDYNQVKALVDGNVNRFMGFEFVMTELLTLVTSTDVRTCIAYQKDGVAFGYGKERSAKISVRDDLSETVQIRTKMLAGAARLEEERVVLVYCDESP